MCVCSDWRHMEKMIHPLSVVTPRNCVNLIGSQALDALSHLDKCNRLFDGQVTGDLKAARCLLDPQSIKIVASPPIYKAFIGILVGRVGSLLLPDFSGLIVWPWPMRHLKMWKASRGQRFFFDRQA